jgi:hypothetical protein
MEAIMARASTDRMRAEQVGNHTVSSAVQHESACTRCGGLLVSDFCMDVLGNIGEAEFAAKRCVQCGEVVDLVILRNRRLRQDSMTVRLVGRMLPNSYVTEGPYK